jgi:hypothetical protein
MGSSLLEFLEICAATLGNELPVVEGVTDVVSYGVTTTIQYSSIVLNVVVVVLMAIVF